MTDKEQGKSFIAEARRTQIIDAAIATLDEIGYVRASLSQIAKRAKISTGLISYHFADKEDLMNQTLITVLENTRSFVSDKMKVAQTNRDKLHTYIVSSLEYQDKHREHYHALLEIIFNARTPDNIPYYKLNDGEEEPLLIQLQEILRRGQKQGEFREFNVLVMSNAIQSAIAEYVGNPNLSAKIDTTTYSDELVKLFDRAILLD